MGSEPIVSWGMGDTIGLFISLNKSNEENNYIRWFKNGAEVNAKVYFSWQPPYEPFFLVALLSSRVDMRLKYRGDHIPITYIVHNKEYHSFDSY